MVHFQILIIGAGTAGLTLAANLLKIDKRLSVGIIDPADRHYYQPAWTLVGAGTYNYEKTGKDLASLIPKHAKWIKDEVVALEPDSNQVHTLKSGLLTYEFLAIAPGMKIAPELLPGLPEALKMGIATSIYINPKETFESLKKFKSGNAVFTQPPTPIKCGGAPQKIMYMTEDYLRKKGKRKDANVIFATPGSKIFGVKDFAHTLNKIVIERDIILKTFYTPLKIDPHKKEIYFTVKQTEEVTGKPFIDASIGEVFENEDTVKIPFELLHVAPPQLAPEFLRNSKIVHLEGNNKGWVNVDVNTLQHVNYPNIFSLGDAAALPTAKTGAAIRKQVPVVAGNIIHLIKEDKLGHKIYEGYTSCPLVTGYGKMVLAEFKYDNVRDSDPFLSRLMDTAKESYLMWILKKYMLPIMYWKMMLKGKL